MTKSSEEWLVQLRWDSILAAEDFMSLKVLDRNHPASRAAERLAEWWFARSDEYDAQLEQLRTKERGDS